MALVNLFGANAFYRVCYESAREAKEARHVRQFGMCVESGLVYPFGVNVKNFRIAQRFVEMNADAPGLGARGLEEQLQFFAELLFFPRDCFEANKSVKRQA